MITLTMLYQNNEQNINIIDIRRGDKTMHTMNHGREIEIMYTLTSGKDIENVHCELWK